MNSGGDRLNWGVLSTAAIGTEKVIPALQAGELGEVRAIASRSGDRAARAARDLGISRHHDSYEALLADPTIDAIYNPLPNHLHVDWSVRALEAGKHVLCEKPLGLDAADARRLLAAAQARPELKAMEAFMYRFHSQWVAARRLVSDGALGDVRSVQSFFSYFNDDPADIRNQSDIGGGALMDIGCYCVSLSRWLFGAEPERVVGTMERDPDFGTDRMTSGMLAFEQGTATFACATQLAPHQRVNVLGTRGRLEIEIPFNAPPGHHCRIWLQGPEGTEELTFDACDQYARQGDAFARAVRDDLPVPTPLEDAVANMEVVDALRRSAETGGWSG